ncbi:nucleotide exchange factor GrpE [Paraneptunicella aestuarii]|uniref:nucleotide exchange factor GrpE n=1 Tax=Paraneptunicella aestuarii TaxID=2831148 RepID=UPI001E430AA4|nr:nucleotide exchange factor GrpE [Paraneptunicella aestuarii]UAA39884.1 nucleotide exchange factor GrpE [Paraneptunicella aestuarii]
MSNEAQNEEMVQEVDAQTQGEQASETDSTAGMTVDEARIQELEAALAKAEATIAEQKDSVLRAAAEAENARRRASAEVEKAHKFALERFAGELLPVADNLERALLSADPANEALKAVMEGVEITHKSFISTIEKFGLEVVDPQGQAFNPEQHQAMAMQESADFAPNTVMAVMQKGYLINGRLLRPAMVVVSRAVAGNDENNVDVEV